MKNKKTAVLLLIIICLPAFLSSCGRYREKNSTPEEKRVVMTIDDTFEVTYDLYRYFYLNYKKSYDDSAFEADKAYTTEAELREKCVASIKGVYATLSLCAEYNIKTSDEDIQSAVKERAQETIDAYGSRAAYLKELKANYLTDAVFRFLAAVDACEDILYSTLGEGLGVIDITDDGAIKAIYSDDFIRIVQILISFDNGYDEDTNYRRAQEALEKLRAGASFDSVIAEYSNDTGMTEDGYYFTYMYTFKEVENASFKLKEGELSGIVESSVGYHIIKRLPKDEDYLMKNYTELKAQYISNQFYSLLDERKEELKLSYTELFNSLNAKNIIMD